VCEVFESLQSADGEWSYASEIVGRKILKEKEYKTKDFA
jgi:hypothetical protein